MFSSIAALAIRFGTYEPFGNTNFSNTFIGIHAPSEELMRLYQAWANGGVGLIITGNVMVDRRAMTPCFLPLPL
jgi:hypothetical protein